MIVLQGGGPKYEGYTSDLVKRSLSMHWKDKLGTAIWLNETIHILQSAGCMETSCQDANIDLLRAKLPTMNQDMTWTCTDIITNNGTSDSGCARPLYKCGRFGC